MVNNKSQRVVDVEALLERPKVWRWMELQDYNYAVCRFCKDIDEALRYQEPCCMAMRLRVFEMDENGVRSIYPAGDFSSLLLRTIDGIANLPMSGDEFLVVVDANDVAIESTWVARLGEQATIACDLDNAGNGTNNTRELGK